MSLTVKRSLGLIHDEPNHVRKAVMVTVPTCDATTATGYDYTNSLFRVFRILPGPTVQLIFAS